MSQAIRVRKFITFFVLYTLASLVVELGTSFTIAAWLVYLFILLPFYLLSIAYIISIALKPYQKRLRYRKIILFSVAIFQVFLIFTSPASCYGFKQGNACYSFIQARLTNVDLTSFQNNPPHWSLVESMFPYAVLLYMFSLIVFLGTIRIEKKGADELWR